jgi:outer membrane protein insertion porin family
MALGVWSRHVWRLSLASVLVAVTSASAASGDALTSIDALLGRHITEVRLVQAGVDVNDPGAQALLETRPGDRLSLAAVRQSMLHLLELGRYEDVRVGGEADGSGVRVIYYVSPRRTIAEFGFRGDLGLSERTLRRALAERMGTDLRSARIENAVALLKEAYNDAGYLRHAIRTTTEPLDRPDRVALVFTIDAGPRARVGRITVEGSPLGSREAVLGELKLAEGQPYDRRELEARIARYVREMRDDRHYEAAIDLSTAPAADGGTVDVTLDVRPGPPISVRWRGDSLPDGVRESLVPIAREGAADEDLLEDSKRRLEGHLRDQGFWRAQVDYERTLSREGVDIVFRVRRGREYRTASVELIGVRQVPEAELRPLVDLHVGRPFVLSMLDGGEGRLLEFYRDRGYALVQVDASAVDTTSPDASPDAPGAIVARYLIVEGPRTTVGSIAFAGAQSVADRDLRQAVSSRPGDALSATRVAADRDAVERLYQNRGFRQVRVDAEIVARSDPSVADLNIAIAEGAQTFVDRVIIVGNRETKAETIERELSLRPGAPLGLSSIFESQRRVSALGLFRSVRITDVGDVGDTRRDVIVMVEEAPATTVGYGLGLEGGERLRRTSEDEMAVASKFEVAGRGFFEVGRRNLWGKNRSVNLFLRGSVRQDEPPGEGLAFNEYRVVGSYREPRILGVPADFDATAIAEQAIRSSFSFRRQGARAELTRRLTRSLAVLGRYRFERTELFDVRIDPADRPVVDRLYPQVRLSTLSAVAIVDTRDDALDPTRGAFLSAEAELAARALGSEVGFGKGFVQALFYRKVPRTTRTVVAAAARLGLADGFAPDVVRLGPEVEADTVDVPVSERFFAGGDTTVRGFTLDRLGTQETLDRNGVPTGGQAVMIFNVELRFPIWRSLGGVLFTDAGNVFRRPSDLDLGEVRGSAGFGVRYKSPIGPIRVDLGVKLDRQTFASGEREDRTAWHIGIGQAF